MPSLSRAVRLTLLACALLVGPGAAGVAATVDRGDTATLARRLIERTQMHRNPLRGVAYVPHWQPGGGTEPAQIRMEVIRSIRLDGDPLLNAQGNVYPIDADGDGRFELLHYNGYRVMRVLDLNGTKLWEVNNPLGRPHRTQVHRDTVAVFDADGDGVQEIAQCGMHPGNGARLLILRDGATGTVLRQLQLTGDPASEECHVAGFRVTGATSPILVVARRAPAGSGCKANYVDTFARVAAFDSRLRRLWERTTCDAGHYVWPLDENLDGTAEGLFVGKYLVRPDGSLRCTLAGWGTDHVDSLLVGDLDAGSAGHEIVAVGSSGTRGYRVSGCAQRWTISKDRIRLPQKASASMSFAGASEPAIYVVEKPSVTNPRLYRIDARGRIVGTVGQPQHYETANVDGATSEEDRVSLRGIMPDREGRARLTAAWFEGRGELSEAERELAFEERWSTAPLPFDMDADGRDELIIWGRRVLLIGRALR
jgi:hypothetical protein